MNKNSIKFSLLTQTRSAVKSSQTKSLYTWTLGIEQQNAFEILKKAFTMAPVLRIPNDKDPFKLSTNASDFATETVLSQKDM